MKSRGKYQGVLTIARLNWPFYLAAVCVLIISAGGIFFFSGQAVGWICWLASMGSFYFLAGSLGVSHQIYDRSDLYRWEWLKRAIGTMNHKRVIFCHSGFDEASEALRETLGNPEWLVLDHFDAGRMTEPSIRRARKLFPPVADTVAAPFDRWPVPSDSSDIVFGLLAIHEFRSEPERSAWFAEARRCLHPGGRIVLVEHVRDFANFLAFGPGFLHFHSPKSWRRCWENAGLQLVDEFRVTPWIRVFVLSSP